MGNAHGHTTIQGWNFPLPEDDLWSCEGTEDSHEGHQDTRFLFQADELQRPADPSSPVSRAVTGSIGAQQVALTGDRGTNELTSPVSRQHTMSHHFDGEQSNWCSPTPFHLGDTVAGDQQPMTATQGIEHFDEPALSHEHPTGRTHFPDFETLPQTVHMVSRS